MPPIRRFPNECNESSLGSTIQYRHIPSLSLRSKCFLNALAAYALKYVVKVPFTSSLCMKTEYFSIKPSTISFFASRCSFYPISWREG